MPLVAYAVRIDLQCGACGVPIAVAGEIDQVTCPGCNAITQLDTDFLEDALSDLENRDQLLPDQARVTSGLTSISNARPDPSRIRTSYGAQHPTCDHAGCEAALGLGTVAKAPPPRASGDKLSIVCHACNTNTIVRRRVPADTMGHDRARGVLLEHRPAPRLAGGGDICVWCPREGCHDVMGLDEYAPTITCDACAEPFALDRAHWDRLTTLPGARPFFVLIEERERKAEPVAPTSFPLSLGWVVSNAVAPPLLFPLFALTLLVSLGPATSMPTLAIGAAIVLGAIIAVIVAINLPGFYRTVVSDRSIELREHELHVPVVTLFQRRPWVIPLGELLSISDTRKSGGSTKLVLALRDGRTHTFSASVVQDRYALISAIERRIGNPQIR